MAPTTPQEIIYDSSGLGNVVASIAQGAPLRILPLGDSITYGYNDPTGNSYRRQLQCLLYTGGNPVAMIGSVRHGDWDNSEASAFIYHTLDQILEASLSELTLAESFQQDSSSSSSATPPPPPNVILLHGGTVNFVLGKNVTEAPARLGHLVDAITERNPDALLVVARLIPYGNATVDAQVQRYNAAVPGLVAARAREGRRVVLTSMRGVTADHVPDHAHPDVFASGVMALRFYQALVEADRRGLVPPAQGPFADKGTTSLPESGQCRDLLLAGES